MNPVTAALLCGLLGSAGLAASGATLLGVTFAVLSAAAIAFLPRRA